MVPDRSEVAWVLAIKEAPPSTDDGCLALLARASDVLCAAEAETSIAGALLAHTRRTALGMAEFVARQDTAGVIVLADLEDLRRYAYAVAGIVGELLTALFAANEPALAGPEVRARLDAEAVLFGEALQLVNILKDAPADAREGRAYLPRGVDRSTVVDLARSDLVHAERYVEVLAEAGGAARTVAFCELPLRLAIATLDRLDAGAAKLTREEVYRIFADVTARRGPRSPA